MKKLRKAKRKAIYEELLKGVIENNLDRICVELGDRLPRKFCNTPTKDILGSFPEFFLFHSESPIKAFSSFWDDDYSRKKEREYRIFILQFCIEMTTANPRTNTNL